MSRISAIRREAPAILALAVPIVAGLGASTLLGVTDSVMLAPLGALPLAAVGITSAVAVILYAAIWGLLSAMSVRIGTAYGAGQGRRIPATLRNGLALGWIAGLGGAALMLAIWPILPQLGQPAEVLAIMSPYWVGMSLAMIPFAVLTVFKATFEAVDRPWLGASFALLAVVINIPLNYALIWGLGPLPMLGLTGAGIASLAAESLALVAAWTYWRKARSMRRLRLRRTLSGGEIASVAREGAPLGLMYIAETGAMAVATLMIGTFGAVALAGNQVAMSVGGLLYMVPLGIAGAVAMKRPGRSRINDRSWPRRTIMIRRHLPRLRAAALCPLDARGVQGGQGPAAAYWTPDQFKARIDARCGWDITDYGQGRFDEMGLFLFTLRNGRLADLQRGGGMCYAEKLLISGRTSCRPMHTHVIKAEDIINRGGATLVVELYGSDDKGASPPTRAAWSVRRDRARPMARREAEARPGRKRHADAGRLARLLGRGRRRADRRGLDRQRRRDRQHLREPIGRFAEIEEDEAPTHLLVSDYDRWLETTAPGTAIDGGGSTFSVGTAPAGTTGSIFFAATFGAAASGYKGPSASRPMRSGRSPSRPPAGGHKGRSRPG
jgi:putative MATE family efflux protein